MAQYQITLESEIVHQLFLGNSKDAGVAKLLETVLNQVLQAQVTEKEIAAQLDESYATLRKEIPLAPKWGVKKSSEGKNVFWYGYKGHLAVRTKSQGILGALLSSGNLNDGKAAIPLLKGIASQFKPYSFKYAAMDAGYDYDPIYKQVRSSGTHAVIAYNRRREPELVGFDDIR